MNLVLQPEVCPKLFFMDLLEDYPFVKELKKLAQTKRANVSLVGGFLRDYIMHRTSQDLDFAVDKKAVDFAKKFADEIKGAFVLLDDENNCARVVKKHDKKIYTYDFAEYRGGDLKEDIRLRDFTINTLVLDIKKCVPGADLLTLIEDHSRAVKDIQDKRIKRVSIRSLRDDPLRILRAFSLQAMLGFRIELSTLNQIKKERKTLADVSSERIREEFFKILDSPRAAATFRQMDKLEVLPVIIPQIKVMYDCTQGGYHHLDVWKHSLEAVRQAGKVFKEFEKDNDIKDYLDENIGGGHSRRSLINFALLLHDIGKPDTRKKEGERYSFHGHEHVGGDISKIISRNLKLSISEKRALEDMVRMHLRPGYLSNFKKPSERAYFRYLRDTKSEAVSIALLSLADQRATRGPLTSDEDQKHHLDICRDVIRRYFEKLHAQPFVPLINGHDLMKKLKLKPSPVFGKILTRVEEEQALGKIKTKEQAMDLAKTMI